MTQVDSTLSSLTVQTVLYCHSSDEVERMVRGIANSVRVTRQHDQIGPVSLIIGDCSPRPVYTLDQVDSLARRYREWGLTELEYDYFGENLGSAAAHNRLLHTTSAPFVLFLNPDTFASPFMLMELALEFSDSRVGIAEARQIPLEHPKEFDPHSGNTSWASTAGCLARRQVIDEVDGFDADSFYLYCDDVDFSWRARLAGYRVVLQPAARLFHDKRLTMDGKMVVGDAEVYYAAEAALMLAWKYSRPDLVESWLEPLSHSVNPLEVRAAERFREREEEDALPSPIDPDGSVAEFIGFHFARHRFSYDD